MTAPIKQKKLKSGTQNADILKHLQNGHSLTPKEGLEKFGTMNLAQRIAQIRAAGYEVQDTWVVVGKARFKKYWIEFNL